MMKTKNKFAQRMLGAVDLAIDFATLGEYGLEPLPTDGTCRERPGRARRKPSRAAVEAPYSAGWEALATARRGLCPGPAPRLRLRDVG
jgi:hypothetical protein